MIKVSALYANGEGKTFDIDYYCNKHMPMVREKLGDACKGIAVERGLAGGAPGSPPPFLAISSVLFDSVASFQAAFGPHAAEVFADTPNFTNVEPMLQISEVKM